MPMIHAETVKAVQELLQERGIQQRPEERLGDYVGRGLGVSSSQAEAFLEALHSGQSVEEARQSAGIPESGDQQGLSADIARAVGTALGRIANQMPG